MKQDKAEKIIQKAERKAKKAAQQVEAAGKKAEAAKQKQAVQAQKKADAATKKAAQKTKKAEAAAKKAQTAAQKAEEKKAKAIAKAASKASGVKKDGEGGEDKGKKKGKKKPLLLLIPVLVIAVGVGAFFFLRGGDKEEEEVPQEPISIPAEYVLDEAHISALPVWGDALVYQDEIKPSPPPESEGEGEEDAEAAAETAGFTKIRYRYEGLQNPGQLVSAYMALMTTEDGGFSTVDETLLRIDPPDLEGKSSGSVQLARNAPKTETSEGGVHSLTLDWSGNNCSVTLDMPEGRVRDPKPDTPSMGESRGLSDLEALHPSKLGLPGNSMDEYVLMPQEGAVRIKGVPCQRVNIYDKNSQIAGSYFLSGDGHLYKLDVASNAVVELEWE